MSTGFASVSPQRPTDVVGEFVDATAEEVRDVLGRAREVQHDWRAMPAADRARAICAAADALHAAAEQLVVLGVREVGKPINEMRGEVARAVAILRFYAQAVLDPDGETLPSPDGRSMLMAKQRPHGVVGLITPWNFPVAIPVWKLAPAIAYGNAAVLKPSPEASAVGALLIEIIGSALPDGLLQMVTGRAATGATMLVEADALSFTGSAAVGHAIAETAGRLGRPFQAEMGGQNASIVLADADPETAARSIAGAAMGFAGQKCTATSRVIVVGKNDRFQEALVAAIASLPNGDPEDPAVAVGPVITAAACRAVVDASVAAGAIGGRVVVGGRRLERAGHFVEPTLIDGLEPHHVLAQEEVFGPIAVLLHARSDEEALRIANGVRYGLAGAVFTSDLERAMRFVEGMEVGLVRVNAPTSGVDFYAPFGGAKQSSLGPREQGKAARDFYTWTQTITMTPSC